MLHRRIEIVHPCAADGRAVVLEHHLSVHDVLDHLLPQYEKLDGDPLIAMYPIPDEAVLHDQPIVERLVFVGPRLQQPVLDTDDPCLA